MRIATITTGSVTVLVNSCISEIRYQVDKSLSIGINPEPNIYFIVFIISMQS